MTVSRHRKVAAAGCLAGLALLAVPSGARAVTAGAAAATSAATADDDGYGRVSVSPATGRPGSTVTVTDGAQCAGASGTASSAAFVHSAELAPYVDLMVADATLAKVADGDYPIAIACSGRTYTGSVHVGSWPVRSAPGPEAPAAPRGSMASAAESAASVAATGLGLGLLTLRRRLGRAAPPRTRDAA